MGIATTSLNNIEELESGFKFLLRHNFPNRNEKYYAILLSEKERLISTNYQLYITADALIRECSSARPTWYSYFKSVKHYYSDVLEVLGSTMIEHAFDRFSNKANYKNWIFIIQSVRLEVFLSNTKSLLNYYPELKKCWYNFYNTAIANYTHIIGPTLQLSPKRAQLLMKNIVNELIMQPEKYFEDPVKLDQFAKREYILFLSEQNS